MVIEPKRECAIDKVGKSLAHVFNYTVRTRAAPLQAVGK
jgi:hypothetical protein